MTIVGFFRFVLEGILTMYHFQKIRMTLTTQGFVLNKSLRKDYELWFVYGSCPESKVNRQTSSHKWL
ncbi:hypothetical protein [Chlamydia pneumoniae J138]|nr:hypothetical protein [Chlamydia pneumoniae J138]